MIFKQYYLGCLSHASYLIGDVRGPGEIESGTIGGYPAWTNLHPTPNEKDSST